MRFLKNPHDPEVQRAIQEQMDEADRRAPSATLPLREQPMASAAQQGRKEAEIGRSGTNQTRR